MTSVHEINDISELAAFRSAWNSLLAETKHATFFQSLEWLEIYWRHFGAEQKLRVLVVLEGGRPTGILPLVVRRESTKVGRLSFLTYPLDYWGSFYGPIGNQPNKTLEAGLEHIRRSRRDWDVMELRWCEDGHCQTEQAMQAQGFQSCKTILEHTALVELNGSWEEYLASRPGKWRNNYRRWQRRLSERGQVTYLRYRPRGDTYDDGNPRWDLYDACAQIASASWQGASQDGTTLTHASVSPFLRDIHALAARTAALDLNLLLLDQRPIAFAYNYCHRGWVYGLRVGYDAAMAREGAGNLLYARAIEDSFLRGDRVYDLGLGSLECKKYFTTSIRPIFRFTHSSGFSPRSQLLLLKRRIDGATAATTLASGAHPCVLQDVS